MKTLYLLRHGKSAWNKPDLPDFDRPLAPRGRRAARAMGDHMAREGLRPDLILCSAARRARETMEHVQDAWSFEVPVLLEREIYDDDAAGLEGRLGRVDPNLGSVLMIGHNPTLQDLTLRLAGVGPAEALTGVRRKFPTAALAVLTFEVPGAAWTGVRTGVGTLSRFVRPRDL